MHRLPEGWGEVEVVEDAIEVGGLTIRRAGLASRAPTGEEILGSAAGVDGSPRARANFELLERAATLEAMANLAARYDARTDDDMPAGTVEVADLFPESPDPARFRFARSNGVALHGSWADAAEAAARELVERDRVLRAWYGETRPEPLLLDGAGLDALARESHHDFRAFRFPAPDGAARPDLDAVGVFGFPRDEAHPFVCGYAARVGVHAAIRAASEEALQLLAFLWGEPVPDDPGSGTTPMHHLDALCSGAGRARIARWLACGHPSPPVARPAMGAPRFVDLTPSWLGGGLRVAKAVAEGATPLTFGASPFAAHLPSALQRHPIP